MICNRIEHSAIRNQLRFVMAFLLLAFAALLANPASAQTYNVIHSFTQGSDGAYPFTGVTIDAGGNLYGTTFAGAAGYGTLFSLQQAGSGWILNTLYTFSDGDDGAGPYTRLTFGPDGALYGATSAGGGGGCVTSNDYHGCGTVFKLAPPARRPASVVYSWNLNTLYRFHGNDGSYPQGDLTFDSDGNIYGTTVNGGNAGSGLVYSLSANNGWSEDILYQAQNDGDGQYPWGGVTFDQAGNLYGVMVGGGPDGYGAVFQLTRSGSGWRESTAHAFSFTGTDGAQPQSGLIADSSGNLYGATVHLPGAGGGAYELTPSGGSWSYDLLSAFHGGINLGPYDKLVMDASGNLYGTTFADGQYGGGSVFELTRSAGGYTYHSLHDFTGGRDGGNPVSALVFDDAGNIYGTASSGGEHGGGVVFEITP